MPLADTRFEYEKVIFNSIFYILLHAHALCISGM
jgi:hypothetical protein